MSSINSFAAHLKSKHPVTLTIPEIITQLTLELSTNKEFISDRAAYEEFVEKVDLPACMSIDANTGLFAFAGNAQTDFRYPYTKQFVIFFNTLGTIIGGWDPAYMHHYATWEEDNDGEIYEFLFCLDVQSGKIQSDFESVLIGLHGHTFTEIEDFNPQQLTQFITDYGYEYDEADPDDDNGPNLDKITSHKDKLTALVKFLQEL
jgi:hypothetical protein